MKQKSAFVLLIVCAGVFGNVNAAQIFGKPGSPLGVQYKILGEPMVGQPLDIRITIQSNATVNELVLQLLNDRGLFVLPEDISFSADQMNLNEPIVRTVTIIPLGEGLHELSVLVQGNIRGMAQANHVAIPIQIGNVGDSLNSIGTMTMDETGASIISMPADQD